jgi:hypothetical protein
MFLWIAAILFVLASAPAVRAGSITTLPDPAATDPLIFTEINFAILNPVGTTVSGFDITYNTTGTGNISALTLLSSSEPPTTFTSNGINLVAATFPAVQAADFRWTFSTGNTFPIANLAFDFTGPSQPVTGAAVTIIVEPVIPEPASAVMFTTGLVGILAARYRRQGRSSCARAWPQ